MKDSPAQPESDENPSPNASYAELCGTQTQATRSSVDWTFSNDLEAHPPCNLEKKITWTTFAYLCRYQKKPISESDALEMSKGDPKGALEYADFYAHETWAEGIVREATLNEPINSLRFSHLYKMQDWAPKIVRLAASKKRQAAVDFADRYCNRPWAKDILLELCDTVPEHIVKNGFGFIKEPWAPEVRAKAEKRMEEYSVVPY
jgi:hypothetical protein